MANKFWDPDFNGFRGERMRESRSAHVVRVLREKEGV
jgi:hypothetical protein